MKKFNLASFFLGSCLTISNSLLLSLNAYASPYESQGPFVNPESGSGIPEPTVVPGKEFSDNLDRDSLNVLDSFQTIAWDGIGGTADGLDYDDIDIFISSQQVDAMATIQDDLFMEVISDSSALLFSTETDSNIYYEEIQSAQGGIWATSTEIDDMNPLNDVDALEVWGLDLPIFADADRFSLEGDPFVSGVGKVSVFAYDLDFGGFSPYITTAELASAVGVSESLFDLDGMMTFDQNLDAVFDDGDLIMFSIAPIASAGIDGGEIYVFEKGEPIQFLEHGGHLWDTNFDVMATYGTATENINALEAISTQVPPVPEPSNLLALISLIGLSPILLKKR